MKRIIETTRRHIALYALSHFPSRFWFSVFFWLSTEEEWKALAQGIDQIDKARRLAGKPSIYPSKENEE